MLKILKLQVTNFRNLHAADVLEFSPRVNCIFGENGNGKTNILEAIYFLTNKKSFRKNTSYSQILSIDGDNPEISFSSVFTESENEKNTLISYSGKVSGKNSEWFLDAKPHKKKIPVRSVFVNPFDSYGFHTNSSFRREWFDEHISLFDVEYKTTLSRYAQALRLRNALLAKKPPKFKEQIEAIDLDMSKYAVALLRKREEFVQKIGPFFSATFKELFDKECELKIDVESRFLNFSEENIANWMKSHIEKDCVIGHTHYGVHRDNYNLLFNGFNSFEYCSLGQQKMAFLSLIFAYIELFRYNYRAYPIVLIDDVSGELDQFRWKNLLELLERKEFQVLITTANENFKKEIEKITNVKTMYVRDGKITKEL